MSARVGPPGPSCISSAYVSGAKSGSSSRPPATRCRKNVSQSRSSGSRRYHAVRRALLRAQSPRSVVLPKPGLRDDQRDAARGGLVEPAVETLARQRVRAHERRMDARADDRERVHAERGPRARRAASRPGSPVRRRQAHGPHGPRTGSTVPAVPPRRRPWPRTIRTPDRPRQRGRSGRLAVVARHADPSRCWSVALVRHARNLARAPLIGRLSEIQDLRGAAHGRLISPRTRSRS